MAAAGTTSAWTNYPLVPEPGLPASGAGGPLSAFRAWLAETRRKSLGAPGCYLDRSETGAGKTRACLAAIAGLLPDGKSLVAVRTHREASELVREFRHRMGLPVFAFPPRTTRPLEKPIACPYCGTEPPHLPERGCRHCGGSGLVYRFVSCWNEDADRAEACGFSVTATVCRGCPFAARCDAEGYQGLNRKASEAQIAVATHKRLEHRGFASVCEGRGYVSVQEDAIEVLRPIEASDLAAFLFADRVFDALFADPRRLNWLAEQEASATGTALDPFLRRMAEISRAVLTAAMRSPGKATVVDLPPGLPRPGGADLLLWRVANEHGILPGQNVFRVLLAAAEGKLHSLALLRGSAPTHAIRGRKNRRRKTGQGGGPRVLAVFRNPPPTTATVWFCDASMPTWRLEAALGFPLRGVIEPSGLPALKQVVHVTEDVTRATADSTVQTLVRDAMALFPDRTQVGILCHLDHKTGIGKLEPIFRGRIAMLEHFWGDAGRGSNSWHRDCDLLIVLGTPRLPPDAIAEELIRLGEHAAAEADGGWGPNAWTGEDTGGRKHVVAGSAYAHGRWQAVYEALVREALRQALGRARANLPDGIDAVVFSTEPLGLPCRPPLPFQLTESAGAAITAVSALVPNRALLGTSALTGEGSGESGNGGIGIEEGNDGNGIDGNGLDWNAAVNAAAVAERIGLKLRQTQKLLERAEAAGILERVGGRRGWRLAPAWRFPNGSAFERTAEEEFTVDFAATAELPRRT